MSPLRSENKCKIIEFLDRTGRADEDGIDETLTEFFDSDCLWEIYHPFNHIQNTVLAARNFWTPMRQAFPDYELRTGILIAGEYEQTDQVSMLGTLIGNFSRPWLGIPATHQLTFLRFALNVIKRDSRIVKAYVMFDLLDLMRQADYYPLRAMPGSSEQWPLPPAHVASGAGISKSHDAAHALDIVLEMQRGLPKAGQVTDIASANAAHSHHWHRNMNWYGPAGIGSSRGLRGFRDYHGALFLQAFPDRKGMAREAADPFDGPGDHTELGDGNFAVTCGWPSMQGTHSGGQWLGLPPTGTKVEMRVAD